MAIATDVARRSSATADAIRNSFVIRIEDARRHAAPQELAAALRSLTDEQDAALAAEATNAQQELHGRQQAAIEARGGQQRAGEGRALTDAEPMTAARPEPTSRTRVGRGAITRQQFRSAGKQSTRRIANPARVTRRRRSGDTGRSFRRAAKRVLHRSVQTAEARHTAAAFLTDTLDWLMLWDAATEDNSAFAQDFGASSNLLSPHP